jgi:hypothetical protein
LLFWLVSWNLICDLVELKSLSLSLSLSYFMFEDLVLRPNRPGEQVCCVANSSSTICSYVSSLLSFTIGVLVQILSNVSKDGFIMKTV